MISSQQIDASNLPEEIDREADFVIPARVWSAWAPAEGKRSIVRELTDGERYTLTRRRAELEEAMAPFGPLDGDRVPQALGRLFGGYPSMRESGAPAVARVHSAMETLRDLPAWAIEEACLDIRRRGYEIVESGRSRFEQHWPPSGAEVHALAARLTARRNKALASARALLTAPVEPVSEDPPRPSKEEVRAQIADITSKADRARQIIGDGNHMARVEADIAARRARRESAE